MAHFRGPPDRQQSQRPAHSVVRSLLQGNWTYESAGLLDRTHLRFFTRREIEKLFHRAGFASDGMLAVECTGGKILRNETGPAPSSSAGYRSAGLPSPMPTNASSLPGEHPALGRRNDRRRYRLRRREPTDRRVVRRKLFHFPWCDDFSAARNESLRHATGDWLFWMDSDDTIPPECGRGLRELVNIKTPGVCPQGKRPAGGSRVCLGASGPAVPREPAPR